MIVKIKDCCTFMEMVKKELMTIPSLDKNGEPVSNWRLTLRISDVLIRYCPFCGKEVEWITMVDWE